MKYYLAIDIGASSGRHVLGHYENNELITEVVYRFKNGVLKKGKHLIWDINNLKKEIINGLLECKKLGKIPVSIGIDTFGVDYVLLDKNNRRLGDVYSYRDDRTLKSKEKLNKLISDYKLYKLTGIQPHTFNTIFQLYDDYLMNRFNNLDCIMFLPSYLVFWLTGIKSNELSIASTSGLLDNNHQEFNEDILNLLHLDKNKFAPLMQSGSYIGNIKKSIKNIIKFDAKVVLSLEHDTGSAVRGALCNNDEIFISSGTRSLIGVVNRTNIITKEAFCSYFTNEINDLTNVRFLKNIMGMWLISETNRIQKNPFSIKEIVAMAYDGMNYKEVFNASDDRFLSPLNMEDEIKNYFIEKKINPPQNLNELFFCIYNSLAHAYKNACDDIETINKKEYKTIIIFGGGCQNTLLNKLTEEICKKKVICGPVEATAIGNILSQIS
jgi:rhamnulokinase